MADNNGDFYLLPEGCIAKVLSFTDPRHTCNSSLVSPIFRSASDSDDVWDHFLPSDWHSLISRSSSPKSVSYASKKELYRNLCEHPLLIDDGTKSFCLDKWTGKKCYMLAARDLCIVWGGTPTYWRWISLPDSRFEEVAELLNVCWLEIRGKIHTSMLSAGTLYGAYLVFKKTGGVYGFEGQPVEVAVGLVGGGDYLRRTVYLVTQGETQNIIRRHAGFYRRGRATMHFQPPLVERDQGTSGEEGQHLKERGDGWLEVELGDFFNTGGGDEQGELEMFATEVRGGHWKGGIVVQGIEVRPKRRD